MSSLASLESTLLVIACVFFIFRRLSTQVVITRQHHLRARYASIFSVLSCSLSSTASLPAVGGQPFFVQTDKPSGLDYIYFSFVSVTTLGFGDFTPATDVGKMAAVIEAIGGQLYLVVVVALFVSRIGRRRMGPIRPTAAPRELSDTMRLDP